MDASRESTERDERLDSSQAYKEIVVTCLSKLGMNSIDEINNMTIVEYQWRIEALNIRNVDKELEMHTIAWLTNQAGSTEKSGKKTVPVYKTFREFFDYQARIENVTGQKTKKKASELHNLLLKANS